MFSGWGIRTIAVTEARFNPMAYHNGRFWPRDTGLAAAGFSRYGFDDLVSAPFSGLFEAAVAVENHRMPELFRIPAAHGRGADAVSRCLLAAGVGIGRRVPPDTGLSPAVG